MKKMILCCDTGVDDAMAIVYATGAAARGKMQLLAVATGFGMAGAAYTYRNTRHLLRLLGSDVPVYRGSDKPLVRPPFRRTPEEEEDRGSDFHGRDGLGNMLGDVQPKDLQEAVPGQSAKCIAEAARRFGKELVIVTTGPLTELAKALQQDEEALLNVGEVVCMAGALAAPGNGTPYAEANAQIDPEAAKLVLESRLPLSVIGLDVTRKTLLRKENVQKWRDIGTPAAKLLAGSAKGYLAAYDKRYPYLGGCALHDPLAVGAALNPEWLTYIPMHLTCVTEGEAAGRTQEDITRCSDKNYTSRGAFMVNAAAFEQDFLKTVEQTLAQPVKAGVLKQQV